MCCEDPKPVGQYNGIVIPERSDMEAPKCYEMRCPQDNKFKGEEKELPKLPEGYPKSYLMRGSMY